MNGGTFYSFTQLTNVWKTLGLHPTKKSTKKGVMFIVLAALPAVPVTVSEKVHQTCKEIGF